MKAPCTWRAGISVSANLRSRVAQASWMTTAEKPWSTAARVLASMHMWLMAPQITNSPTPAAAKRSFKPVSRKLLGKCLLMTVSPCRGAIQAWICTPGVSGRKKAAPSRVETCWIW